MEQKDIDRLLICRAAIDKHRAFNASRVATIEASLSTAKAVVKESLEPDRTASTLEMNEVVKGQGFGSVSEFGVWNEAMNFEAFKECYPVAGSCDWCGEKEFLKQNCAVLFGLVGSCGEKKPSIVTDQVAKSSYWRYIKGETEIKDGVLCSISYCPAGHGYYNDVKNFKTPPFDVFWRV